MASGHPFFDDSQNIPEVIDPPPKEAVLDISENVNENAESTLKPNAAVTSGVRELLECPVCLNAMYPPISQVRLYLVSET